ncbi:hypothetical protein [Methylosinus sp. PW1]|uniref:hypothetical protein n=1 Tax=Methylosinus sp. PW1 TaxID=107636 RepID=UPI0012EB83D0|nr:hypothetical protein [Methylosinus sp. PW1]
MAAALDYDNTLIGALELSSKKWVFAVQVPGSRKHTKYTVEPNGPALAALLETLKARSAAAGKPRSVSTILRQRDLEFKLGVLVF